MTPSRKTKRRRFKPDAPCGCAHPWREHLESDDEPPRVRGCTMCDCEAFERDYVVTSARYKRKVEALHAEYTKAASFRLCDQCACPSWWHISRAIADGSVFDLWGDPVRTLFRWCRHHGWCGGAPRGPSKPPGHPRSRGVPRLRRKGVLRVQRRMAA